VLGRSDGDGGAPRHPFPLSAACRDRRHHRGGRRGRLSRRYRVTGSEVVRWDRFAVVRDAPISELALSTCYPFGAIRHGLLRYVVHAEQVA
jgi:hypothetical protein